jgi:hypothetical protein
MSRRAESGAGFCAVGGKGQAGPSLPGCRPLEPAGGHHSACLRASLTGPQVAPSVEEEAKGAQARQRMLADFRVGELGLADNPLIQRHITVLHGACAASGAEQAACGRLTGRGSASGEQCSWAISTAPLSTASSPFPSASPAWRASRPPASVAAVVRASARCCLAQAEAAGLAAAAAPRRSIYDGAAGAPRTCDHQGEEQQGADRRRGRLGGNKKQSHGGWAVLLPRLQESALEGCVSVDRWSKRTASSSYPHHDCGVRPGLPPRQCYAVKTHT